VQANEANYAAARNNLFLLQSINNLTSISKNKFETQKQKQKKKSKSLKFKNISIKIKIKTMRMPLITFYF